MALIETHEEAEQFATHLERHKDELVPPSPEQIDSYIAQYEYAKKAADEAKELVDVEKSKLVFLADNFGHRPPHAEQSVRLQGLRNAAVVTRGTTVVVDEAAVQDFHFELSDTPGLFARIFAARTKHTLIEGARDVLKTIQFPRRRHERILAMFGKCIDVKTNSPSLKVEVIKPEKPAKKPRLSKSGKAAA